MDTIPIPDRAFRGLRKSDWAKDEDFVPYDAFLPDKSDRPDRALGTSISFDDDEGAIARLKQTTAAKFGIARFSTAMVGRASQDQEILGKKTGQVWLERTESHPRGDPYHGDILFGVVLTTYEQKRVAFHIAAGAHVEWRPSQVVVLFPPTQA